MSLHTRPRSSTAARKPRAGTSSIAVLLLLAAGAWLGCEQPGPAGGDAPASGRAPDGLLENPVLQEIVEHQRVRDGDAIVPFLDDGDPIVRARAAFALASVQAPGPIGQLREMLDDPDPRVRADVVLAIRQWGLGNMMLAGGPGTGAGPLMAARLEVERDPVVRAALYDAISTTGSERAIRALLSVSATRADDAALALALTRAASQTNDIVEADAWLGEHIDDPDPTVRRNVSFFFAELGGVGDDRILTYLPRLRATLGEMALDDPASVGLILGLSGLNNVEEDDAQVPEDLELIARFLQPEADWKARVTATAALLGYRDTELASAAWDHLFAALGDPEEQVRISAAAALAEMASGELSRVETLKGWIDGHPGDWRTSWYLVAPIAALDPPWVTRWAEERLTSSDRQERIAATQALGQTAGRLSTELLLGRALEAADPLVGRMAMEGLSLKWQVDERVSDLHDDYFEAFLAGLDLSDLPGFEIAAYRLATVDAFRDRGGPAALEARFAELEDRPDLQQATISQLAAGGGAVAVRVARAALSSEDPSVRFAAAEALRGLGEDPGTAAPPDRSPPELDWDLLRSYGPAPRLVLETTRGRVEIEIDVEEAPLTAQVILGYAADGRYDGTIFHRVIPALLAQGGDFARGDGRGAPLIMLPTEATRIPFVEGTVGLASSGRDTEGSQFFVALQRRPGLDAAYTAFGRVVEGLDAVASITEGDILETATVVPTPG